MFRHHTEKVALFPFPVQVQQVFTWDPWSSDCISQLFFENLIKAPIITFQYHIIYTVKIIFYLVLCQNCSLIAITETKFEHFAYISVITNLYIGLSPVVSVIFKSILDKFLSCLSFFKVLPFTHCTILSFSYEGVKQTQMRESRKMRGSTLSVESACPSPLLLL